MNEIAVTLWRRLLAQAVVAGFGPAQLMPVPVKPGDAEGAVTVRRLADRLEADQVPPAVCAALRLPDGARFADAVRVLRERWG